MRNACIVIIGVMAVVAAAAALAQRGVRSSDPSGELARSSHPLVELVDDYSPVARMLAGRLSQSPWIDAELAARIDRALEQIKQLAPELTIPTMNESNAPSLIVSLSDGAAAGRWAGGRTRCGVAELDQLGEEFGLKTVRRIEGIGGNVFKLQFEHFLNLDRLAEQYKRSPVVVYAENNGPLFAGGCGGSGSGNMWALKENDVLHLVFARGWGDCPSGCIHCEYFYFTVANGRVELVDRLRDQEKRSSYTWNIPH